MIRNENMHADQETKTKREHQEKKQQHRQSKENKNKRTEITTGKEHKTKYIIQKRGDNKTETKHIERMTQNIKGK